MGDEIGPSINASVVNGSGQQLRMFQRYLRQVSDQDPSFFGDTKYDALQFVDSDSPDMGRYERRLFYHSSVYRWLDTARLYAKKTAVLRALYPNILTMANYSPYTVFYLGAGMDRGQNSFVLPRANACTGHWGEDWLAPRGVSSVAGVQTESFYASVQRCGSQKYGQPTGFFMVWKLGDLDRKWALLISHGIKYVYAYHWGPRYLGGGSPESSSHRTGSYAQLNRTARALGPADRIIAEGQREQARVALLYNRTDETWNHGAADRRTDRIYTFLALRHAHVPVDLILEDDCNPTDLARFRVVYLNGVNIRHETVSALRDWVEAGGTLVTVAGTAMRDEYDDPLTAANDLFGAAQQIATSSTGSWEPYQDNVTAHEPIDTVRFDETPLTPAIQLPVVGLKTVLSPKTATAVARYTDGTCAAVVRDLGLGRVLVLGVMPGYLYAHNAPRDDANHPVHYKANRRALVVKPVLAATGAPTVTHTEPLVELARFDHPDGIAVIMTDLSYRPGRPGTLRVRTNREVTRVEASLAGALEWKRANDTIEIQCSVPAPVDVVILR